MIFVVAAAALLGLALILVGAVRHVRHHPRRIVQLVGYDPERTPWSMTLTIVGLVLAFGGASAFDDAGAGWWAVVPIGILAWLATGVPVWRHNRALRAQAGKPV